MRIFTVLLIIKKKIMGILCKCPRAAALPDIPHFNCGEDFGQVQKVAFQRLRDDSNARNGFTSEADIKTKASWTPFLSAEDSTKIVVSPYIQNPETTPGGPRTFGGGNETLGGIEEIIGSEPTEFTGVIRKAPQAVIKAVKQLGCEEIGVYLFGENGNIAVSEEDGMHYPIPVRSFFVGDKMFGGFENPDSNSIQWNFLPNYSDNIVFVWPEDFNPLNDLVVTP